MDKKPDYSFQKPLITKAYDYLIAGERVCLAGTCGSGKTRMAIEIAKKFTSKGFKVLILAHGQVIIRSQWVAAIGESAGEILKNKELSAVYNSSSIIVALPQSLENIPEEIKFDLVIVDEAHERFFEKQVQTIIDKVGYKKILCLTGTPSDFLKDKSWKVVGIAFEDLVKHGVATPPETTLAIGDFDHKIKSYNKSMNIKSDIQFSGSCTKTSMDKVLGSCAEYLGYKEGSVWGEVIDGLGKTMIACHSQQLATHVHNYFESCGIKSLISISDFGDGDEIEIFKSDKSFNVLVVVRRGVLGFDYPELCNVIDMTYSMNAKVIFQLLSRVTRRGGSNKKMFLKLSSEDTNWAIAWVMSYVVALWTKKWFFKPINSKSSKVPVKREFVEALGFSGGGGSSKVRSPTVPKLPTFKEVTEEMDNLTVMGRASFNGVCSAVYGSRRLRNLQDSLEEASQYSSLLDLSKNGGTLYSWFYENGYKEELHNILPPARRLRELKTSMKEASKYDSLAAFKKGDLSLCRWFYDSGHKNELHNILPPRNAATLKEQLKTAKKYKSLRDLSKNNPQLNAWFYVTKSRKEALHKIHKPARVFKERTLESALEEVRKYKSLAELGKKNKALCSWFRVDKMRYSELCKMHPPKGARRTLESALIECAKYRSFADLNKNSPYLKRWFYDRGYREDLYKIHPKCKHTLKSALEDAAKHDNLKSFKAHNRASVNWLYINGYRELLHKTHPPWKR